MLSNSPGRASSVPLRRQNPAEEVAARACERKRQARSSTTGPRYPARDPSSRSRPASTRRSDPQISREIPADTANTLN